MTGLFDTVSRSLAVAVEYSSPLHFVLYLNLGLCAMLILVLFSSFISFLVLSNCHVMHFSYLSFFMEMENETYMFFL